MKPITPADSKAIDHAEKTLAMINRLKTNPDFGLFMDGFRRRADALANEILHDEMKPKKREAVRQYRLGILEVLGAPQTNADACERTLKTYGIG